jgi:hypothetical protein
MIENLARIDDRRLIGGHLLLGESKVSTCSIGSTFSGSLAKPIDYTSAMSASLLVIDTRYPHENSLQAGLQDFLIFFSSPNLQNLS